MSALDEVRQELCRLHGELVRYQLVVWTAGNVSARLRVRASGSEPAGGDLSDSELMVIKASGVRYDDLTPEHMVVCTLDGTPVDGDGPKPSSDTAAHAYVYRAMPDVGGVVHTHSPYATAWAARGEPVPCVLTGIADEFGGQIPIGPFARVGGDDIGRGIVHTLQGHRSPAVLMRSHGVFAIGPTADAAVKAAVMCEDAARTVHLARELGEPLQIAPDDIDALHHRYQNVYGQR